MRIELTPATPVTFATIPTQTDARVRSEAGCLTNHPDLIHTSANLVIPRSLND